MSRPLSSRASLLLAIAGLAALALVIATGVILGIRRRDQRARARIEVVVEDADLREVIAAIGKRAGQKIIVEPDVHEQVTISLRDIPWRDAVDVIAKMTKCEVVERGDSLVLTQPPRVTIQDMGAGSIRASLELLAAYAHERVVFANDVAGPCRVSEVRDEDWWSAFQRICRSSGLVARRANGVIFVSSRAW